MSLRLEGLSVCFTGVPVLRDVSLQVEPGTVAGLIGPNGAGKTTLIDAVTGFVPYDGSVSVAGTSLDRRSTDGRSRAGVARTFQSLELFEDLDVEENLRVVADAAGIADVGDVLDRLDLRSVARRRPATLGHDERARVALARAVVARPQVLLLDEPAAGLDDAQRAALAVLVRELADEGTAVVLVDHDADLVLRTADVVHVLHQGRLLTSGRPDEVRVDPRVQEAYLGASRADPPRPPRTGQGAAPALVVEAARASYDGVPALRGVSLTAAPGEVLAVLGRNGAGKSTLLSAVAGLHPLDGGSVEVLGRRRAGAVRTARSGVVLVPQDRGLLLRLTVRQNLRLARRRVPVEEVVARFPDLTGLLDRPVATLSGGQQQQLALARALLRAPRLLLVDELSLGLAPQVVLQLLELLRETADDSGTAIVLVEQHAALALAVADRACVLDRGAVVVSGSAQQLAADPALLSASYLGG